MLQQLYVDFGELDSMKLKTEGPLTNLIQVASLVYFVILPACQQPLSSPVYRQTSHQHLPLCCYMYAIGLKVTDNLGKYNFTLNSYLFTHERT